MANRESENTMQYKLDIIKKHSYSFENSSAYILNCLYHEVREKNKNEKLNPEVYELFGISSNSRDVTIFDWSEKLGYYDSILVAFLFSFGNNIESFFKEYCSEKITNLTVLVKKYNLRSNIFQRIDDVILLLKEGLNINFEKDIDFQQIKKFMQLRHIYMHNDGIIDEKFLQRTGTDQFQLEDIYPLDTKELNKMVNAYRSILSKLDK